MFKNFSVMIQLLRRDLIQFKRQFFTKVFDTAFLLFTNLIVFGYFMPQYGVKENYGPFIFIGAIASFGFFDIIGKISNLISDIEGERTISYTLTLPLQSWHVFAYIGIYWALNSALVTLLLFPFGKLILFDQVDVARVCWMRLVLIYVTMNIFYGFFSLWLASLIKNVGGLSGLWIRVINPLFMFGGYFYSWHSVYQFSPSVAFATLADPLVYAMEGMRAAAFGQEGYIPFWICVCVLWVFIISCGWHAICRLQKRLDCV